MPSEGFTTRSWIETMSRPAAVIGSNRRIEAVNRLFLSTFEASSALVGQPCYKVLHGLSRPCPAGELTCPLDRCLRNLQPERSVHLHSIGGGISATKVVMRPLSKEPGMSEDVLGTFEILDRAGVESDRQTLVGESDSFLAMMQEIDATAESTVPVLLQGETGTGKRFIALNLHRAGPWSKGFFEELDCRALTEDRFDSVLTSYVERAHSLAERIDLRVSESAPLGTLYLGRVHALPLSLQSRLASMLDSRVLGSKVDPHPVASDLRLIASTETELSHRVRDGTFLRELAMWLSLSVVRVPPLRERRADIPWLAESLLARTEPRPRSHRLSDEAIEVLQRHDYPDNVRELASILERARLQSPDRIIRPEHLVLDLVARPAPGQRRLSFQGEIVSLRELEDAYLEWVSNASPDSQRELARRLGVSERTLYRKLSRMRKGRSNGPTGESSVAGSEYSGA